MTVEHRVRDGSPILPGVTLAGDGVNVAIHSAAATAIWFCLFDADGMREVARFRLPQRTGDIHHGWIGGVGAGARYGFRADGPFAPDMGCFFNPAKLLVDPDAVALDRPFRLTPALFDHGRRGGVRDDVDSAADVPKAIVGTPVASASDQTAPRRRIASRVIYELNVRAFTMRHPGVPEPLRGTLAALAQPGPLAHLTTLGITTVELMPLAAWIDERHLPALGLANAWGYNPVVFGAPDPRVVPGGWAEVRATTDRLHAAGLEVVLDVVLNHTGESDADGPTLSLRGLDNAAYYRLLADDPSRFVNDTGCGNTVALDRPHVVRLVTDALRRWAVRGGIDGFRFDLATVMGRTNNGFDPAAPLLTAIMQDPVLSRLTLIAEPWDLGPGGYRLGAFPSRFDEWNDRFRDTVRRTWRGDGGLVGDLATRLAGSADIFGRDRVCRTVNFVTAHDGFTLRDLVSYARKHNAANGENDRDGRDENFSWNNGVEGETGDTAVIARRHRDQLNLLTTLILARGTPMLAMGAEFGHTQGGNNNAYAQDNATTWLDWSAADRGLIDETARLVALRQAHPVLQADRFLIGSPQDETGLPDGAWFNLAGLPMTDADWHDAGAPGLMLRLYQTATDDMAADGVLIAPNAGHADCEPLLPPPRCGFAWYRAFDTAAPGQSGDQTESGESFQLAARSVVLLSERPAGATVGRKDGATTEDIDRLARAVGIAPEWWEISGRHHLVSDETKRALLAAMGFAASSRADVRDGLARLSEQSTGRVLPRDLIGRPGKPVVVSLAEVAQGRRPMPAWLTIVAEDGVVRPQAIGVGIARVVTGADGRTVSHRDVSLPALPAGRYRIIDETRPEHDCHLTVAPERCHLPETLAVGGGAFGVSAQLYGVRQPGDQGIGDLTTLTALIRASAAHGARTVGINPLHALFTHDRQRASPYYPSDRRVIDELYVDVVGLAERVGSKAGLFVLAGEAGTLGDLRAGRSISYPGVARLKRRVLTAIFDDLRGRSDRDPYAAQFLAFVRAAPSSLAAFATFEACAAANPGVSWMSWKEPYRTPSLAARQRGPGFERERMFALFVQWAADLQLGEAAVTARESGLDLGLYRDLAVGAAPDGSETWSGQGLFARGVAVGAPPDAFSETGQNWGLTPWSPVALAEARLRPFRELIDANMRHAGLLRIDHILGLERQFWVPDGGSGADGAYVSFPRAGLFSELALASHEHRCVVVGEDLGTVPDGLRERLAAAQILGTRVMAFERDGRAYAKPPSYPRLAVACAASHDLPTLAGWWSASDIAERQRIGLLRGEAVDLDYRDRAADKAALLDALRSEGFGIGSDIDAPELTDEVAAAIHAYLAATSALLVFAQVEDLAGAVETINIPGTDRERPNWRARLDIPLAAVFSSDRGRNILERFGTRRRAVP